MNYHIRNDISKSAYLQLYEQLRRDITAGLFPYGTKLPSKRLLAEELGISVITVEHSYALLCEEGYVDSRERSGYFVIYREEELFSPAPLFVPLREESPSEAEDREDGFPFSLYAKKVRKVLSQYGPRLFSKGSRYGCMELRSALSGYLARARGIFATPEQIVIGSGAEYFYGSAVRLLGRERCYGVEDPSYAQITGAYRSLGVETELLPLRSDGIDSAALLSARADVLHVTPYQSFPSGASASASKKREYLRWAEKKEGRYLVEDDFQSEFTLSRKPEDTLFALSASQNVIYLNTFSKTVSPSIRVSYMVLPSALLAQFEERSGVISCPVPLLEQLVLAELISDGDFERHINRVRRNRRRRTK